MGVSVKLDGIIPVNVVNRIINDKVKLFANNTLFKYCDPFVPMDSGSLSKNVEITAESVHYKSSYAHYLYMGQLMVAPNGSAWAKQNEVKHYVNKKLNFDPDKHPTAAAHWEKAMMISKGKQFIGDIQAFIERG